MFLAAVGKKRRVLRSSVTLKEEDLHVYSKVRYDGALELARFKVN